MEIKLKDGNSITFEEFIPKESNLIKINLNDDGRANGEGIWACISDKDLQDYQANATDSEYKRVATMRNDALIFYPHQSWGAYIPYKLNGDSRPICNISVIADGQEMLFNKQETQ
jgi:hypothetical protein